MPTTNLDKRGDGKGRDKEEALAMGYFIENLTFEILLGLLSSGGNSGIRIRPMPQSPFSDGPDCGCTRGHGKDDANA